MNNKRIEILKKLKNQKIIGKIIDLEPCQEKHLDFIVNLRNKSNVKYFLSQKSSITFGMQLRWYQDYSKRINDLYYIIQDKKGKCLGTISLYNIDFELNTAEKGRKIVDEKYTLTKPIALESDILIFELAFEKLELSSLFSIVKKDNIKVINLNKRYGFYQTGENIIRNDSYLIFQLNRNDAYKQYSHIIEHWNKKHE